jgi:hypothetical protein
MSKALAWLDFRTQHVSAPACRARTG